MKRAFGDSHYFLALLNPRDRDHESAVDITGRADWHIVTTRWILAEVADGLASSRQRATAVAFLYRVEQNPFVTILPPGEEQFARGFQLYESRPDKEWSLTDCISFVVMSDEGLSDALTVIGTSRRPASKRCLRRVRLQVRR